MKQRTQVRLLAKQLLNSKVISSAELRFKEPVDNKKLMEQYHEFVAQGYEVSIERLEEGTFERENSELMLSLGLLTGVDVQGALSAELVVTETDPSDLPVLEPESGT